MIATILDSQPSCLVNQGHSSSDFLPAALIVSSGEVCYTFAIWMSYLQPNDTVPQLCYHTESGSARRRGMFFPLAIHLRGIC